MTDDRRRIRVTVDEIEMTAEGERVALLIADDGNEIAVPLALLPEGTRHGDVLTITTERDPGETERRRRRILDLQQRLFKARDEGRGSAEC